MTSARSFPQRSVLSRFGLSIVVTVAIGWASVCVAAAPGGTRLAPRFQTRDVTGQAVSLDTLLARGPVLLDFWATWCKPCVTSLPGVERLSQEFKSAGLTVVAISIDGPRNFAKVRPFARSLGLTFPIVLDEDGTLARRFEVTAVPTSILIAPDRRIAHLQLGYTAGQEARLREAIVALLPGEAVADSSR